MSTPRSRGFCNDHSQWSCDSHLFFRSSIQVDWNVNVCWKRIVCWCHWSRIQVTTIASHITVLRLHHVRSWRNRHVRLHCTTTIHVFHPDMFTWFQRTHVDHSVTFIKRFLLTLLIFTLCLPCILEMWPLWIQRWWYNRNGSSKLWPYQDLSLTVAVAQGSCPVREKCFILVLALLQETSDCFHSSLRNSVWLRIWTACSVSESMSISKCSERLWRVLRTIVCDDNFWNSMPCKYGFQIVHDRGWRSVVQFRDFDKCRQVVNNE